jgi:hypothetical protein
VENPAAPSADQQHFEIPMARWALWLAAFLVFIVVMTGKVRYTEGDSRYSLLATMSLMENGNLRLDNYVSELDLEALNNGHNWMIFRSGKDSHFYYDYPVGTQVFALPFVWVGKQLGMNPIHIADDTSMQIGIAAILCVLIFLLMHRLARLYLGEWASLLFALAIFFGTPLISTMGTALWSHNFQTLFTVLVLLELAEWERGKRPKIRGAWMGFLLFAAYLCRPTSAALVVAVVGWLVWKNRKALPWTLGVSGGLFLLFMLWSWLEFQLPLPRYYDPTLWKPGTGFWEHLLPLWFGPARGLWSFTPALILVFAGWAIRKVRFQPLHLMVWLWLILHTYLLMRSQSPWAGWSFGPRFFTEVVPGLALILLLIAQQLPTFSINFPKIISRLKLKFLTRRQMLASSLSPLAPNPLPLIFILLSMAGIYIHTFQGLNNIETQAWNDNPNIDQHWPERRWDWRHPQFLASAYQRTKLEQETATKIRLNQLLQRLPQGATFYYGPPDPNLRQCFIRWNRQDHFGRGQLLCNSLYTLQSVPTPEFWFSAAQIAEVREFPGVTIDSVSSPRMNLGDFLKANAQFEVLIAGKDDATTSLSLETRAYMRSLGSQLDSVKLRDSYIAHLQAGKLVYERWGQEKLEYYPPGRGKVRVQSAGLFVGNMASIKVDGHECSMNMRGMNVAVLDRQRNIVWCTNFDTHADDREKVAVMKGTLSKAKE